MVAGRQGYPNSVNDLNKDAANLIAKGITYKTSGQTGISVITRTSDWESWKATIGSGAWDIRFPGTRLYSTGEMFVQADIQNYSESEILKAAELYRAILFINPSDTEAAKGLLQTYQERMIPLIFAGNTSQMLAFLNRYAMTSLTYEIGLLDEGVAHYRKAAGIFVELTETPSDLKYLDGTAGSYSDYKDIFKYDTLIKPDSGTA